MVYVPAEVMIFFSDDKPRNRLGASLDTVDIEWFRKYNSPTQISFAFTSRGGYLVCLSDWDVPFFRVSFSPIFSRTGYQKKANFLEQVVKAYQKRKFRHNGLLFRQIFVFLMYTFYRFILEQGII